MLLLQKHGKPRLNECMWEITGTQDEETFLDDHVETILASDSPELPPRLQSLGETTVRWDRVDQGAFIQAQGGTVDDRLLARSMVATQLREFGIPEATQTWDRLQRTADWNDVMDKARRLIQSGRVRLLRNGYQNIVAVVQGDGTDNDGKPDSHQVEIFRQDPSSRAITMSDCNCAWGEYQNQPRTRMWKKFQDRPCSHALAAYWLALSTPLDEDLAMQQQQGPQGAPPGIGAPSAPQPAMMSPSPQPGAGASPVPGQDPAQQGPSPADVLPQFQTEPDIQQQNPASVPGLRGPTPTNPVNYPPGPGGTFSSWQKAGEDYWQVVSDVEADPRFSNPLNNGDIVQLRYPDVASHQVGRTEGGEGQLPMDEQGRPQLAAGLLGEVLGTDPTTGMVSVLYSGSPWGENVEKQPFGAVGEHWRSWLIHRPDVKRPGPAYRRTR